MPIRLTVALFLILLSAPEQSCTQTVPTWPAAEWPHSEPESQGMRSAELANMLDQLAKDNPGIRSVTVVRHGTVVLDVRISPFSRGDRHDIHSCTKSVLSALIGIAMSRGDLPGRDTPVLSFFPEYETAHLDPGKRAMTLGHLLTMSAGLKTEDSYIYNWVGLGKMRASKNWAQYILDLPMETEPGTRFEYSNGVSELLAIILQEATGQSAEAYAREHLFGPIGIVDHAWEGSRRDDSWGFSGLSLRSLDMARLGYLYLRGGEWDGVPIVPADWVKDSTSPQIAAGTMAKSYGYQWWVGEDMFMMLGYGGQFVYVHPALDLVVVFTGALPQDLFFAPLNLLRNHIEPAVISDHAISANPDAAAQLDSLVQILEKEPVEPLRPLPDLAKSISGKKFIFAENTQGLRHLILRFTPGSSEAEFELFLGGVAVILKIGLDGVFRTNELLVQRWAWRGRWVNGETFELEQEALGKVFRKRVTIKFAGDTLSLESQDQVTGLVDIYSAKMTAAPPVGK